MNFKWKGAILGAAGTVIVCLMSFVSAGSQAGQAPRPQMSEEAFKNVQVLKGIPVDEFMDTMGMFSSALGLCCTDCHVKDAVGNVGAFSVQTPKIQTARGMILMMNNINKNFFGGAKRVSCFSCHRGGYVPEAVPDLALQYSAPPDESPNAMDIANSTDSPQPFFDKYIQALGGAQRVNSFTSFTATGTYTGYETGMGPVKLEVYAKAPNQRTLVLKMPEEDSVRVYDGSNGWMVGPERPVPLTSLTGGNLFGYRVDAVTSFPAGIQKEFTQWKSGSTTIDDHPVSVAQGSKAGQLPVNFYFDEKSGLLTRVVRWNDTAVGAVPTQIDFEDYRPVGGMQFPFRTIVTWTNGKSTIQLSDVRPNVAIDAARFARPTPGRQR